MELLEQGSGFPVDEIKIQSALRRRLIYLIGDITESSVFETEYLLDRIVALDKAIKLEDEDYVIEPITIRLQTGGGSSSPAMGLIGQIEKLKDDGYFVIIDSIGYCMSMGAIIITCGSHRRCHRYDKFMIHSLSAGVEGKLSDMQNTIKEFNSIQKTADEIITSKTKITQKMLTSKSNADWYLTAQEALEYGLVDEIL